MPTCIVCGGVSAMPGLCLKCQRVQTVGQLKKWQYTADAMLDAREKMASDARLALAAAIEDICKMAYTSWRDGFEYRLWAAVMADGPTRMGGIFIENPDKVRISVLAENAGCWYIREGANYVPVELSVWIAGFQPETNQLKLFQDEPDSL